jgi:hypothetical protein
LKFKYFLFSIIFLIPLNSFALNVEFDLNEGPLPSASPTVNITNIFSKSPAKSVRIGTWVKYSIQDNRVGKNSSKYYLKLAFVGREEMGRLTWMEISLNQGGQTTYIKLLYEGDPGRVGKTKRLIVQFGNMQPMETPVEEEKKLLPIIFRAPIVQPRVIEKKDFSSPVGIFRKASHIKSIDPDGNIINLWMHKSVLMWGMLKINDGRFIMELVDQGFGARSRIKGEPAKLTMPKQ